VHGGSSLSGVESRLIGGSIRTFFFLALPFRTNYKDLEQQFIAMVVVVTATVITSLLHRPQTD